MGERERPHVESVWITSEKEITTTGKQGGGGNKKIIINMSLTPPPPRGKTLREDSLTRAVIFPGR